MSVITAQEIDHILLKVESASSVFEKIDILNRLKRVTSYFDKLTLQSSFFSSLSPECEYVIKALITIGQEHVFEAQSNIEDFRNLLLELNQFESDYNSYGGILGYQKEIFAVLTSSENKITPHIEPPKGIDLTKSNTDVDNYIHKGIAHLDKIAEVYVLGGVADRLSYKENQMGPNLPAAILPLMGKELLSLLIRDLEAREYLFQKLFGKKIITPIVMMTSNDKKNHDCIFAFCEKKKWFNRPKSSFYFIKQPLIPAFDKQGKWALEKPSKLLLKPGGHGEIWHLAYQEKILSILSLQSIETLLFRQVNNPVASSDYGLLGFIGYGANKNKKFGFLSCKRKLHTKEGVNVFVKNGLQEGIASIEYCHFSKYGMEDALSPEDQYSKYPSNTNILFVDIKKLIEIFDAKTLYQPIANFKTHTIFDRGKEIQAEIARLETLAQDLAVELHENKQTFISYYQRQKTISTTKQLSSNTQLETPVSCLYDIATNHAEILSTHCKLHIPKLPSRNDFEKNGPSFLFDFHPALGPIYSIIGHKIQRGSIDFGAELYLEIVDVSIRDLQLQGSLRICGDKSAICCISNFTIRNASFQSPLPTNFWQSSINRVESCHIVLHEGAQLIAKNVTIQGDFFLEVMPFERVTLENDGLEIKVNREIKCQNSPYWTYYFDNNKIQLKNPLY